jgi:hypothetical protein
MQPQSATYVTDLTSQEQEKNREKIGLSLLKK